MMNVPGQHRLNCLQTSVLDVGKTVLDVVADVGPIEA